jgi:hypothetical protein
MKWDIVPNSSLFDSIREVHSQGMIADITDYEKKGPAFIGTEELKAIGRLVRPIKVRIEAASMGTISGSFTGPLAVGSYAAFSQIGGAQ